MARWNPGVHGAPAPRGPARPGLRNASSRQARLGILAGGALALVPLLCQAQPAISPNGPGPTVPERIEPPRRDPGAAPARPGPPDGAPGAGRVLPPPGDIDPGMRVPAPDPHPHTTPVPPGSQGGRSGVQPR